MKTKRNKCARVATEAEKLHAVHLIYNRLHRGFTLYHWIRQVFPMLHEHPRFQEASFEIFTVKNACVESTLLSVRDIDDFFRPRVVSDRGSDLRATDFYGFKSPGPFLFATERESINQWIAHLTYAPVWTGTSGIAPDPARNWNSADLVG